MRTEQKTQQVDSPGPVSRRVALVWGVAPGNENVSVPGVEHCEGLPAGTKNAPGNRGRRGSHSLDFNDSEELQNGAYEDHGQNDGGHELYDNDVELAASEFLAGYLHFVDDSLGF